MSQSLIDFVTLVDKCRGVAGHQSTSAEVAEVEKSGELAAWLLSMSAEPPADAGELSVTWWRKTHNTAWLISALANAPARNLPELLAAARRIPSGAPAYESVAYYAISQEMDQGHTQEARLWSSQALSHNLLLSSRNLILAQSSNLARNWSEALYFDLRRPEPHIVKLEGDEVEASTTPLDTGTTPVFVGNINGMFNYVAPLPAWLKASRNTEVPASMQLRIAVAGWFRAVLLARDEDARKFMQRVVTLQPKSASVVDEFLAARNPEEARFAAVYLVLRTPALRPALLDAQYETVDFAVARNVATDAGGRRYGCWFDGWARGMHSPPPGSAAFLTAAERNAGETESEKTLEAEPWEATYLARESVAWALKHPGDPRVPEASHRAVMASYYRCTDENTGKYSKQAFDLLHRQYPDSPWTAQTPYWYR